MSIVLVLGAVFKCMQWEIHMGVDPWGDVYEGNRVRRGRPCHH